ncbi:amino acid ABC transporter permease, partial [Streptomyces sp. NPDC047916]
MTAVASPPHSGNGAGPHPCTRGATTVAPETIRAIPVRHVGRWISGVVVLALLAA